MVGSVSGTWRYRDLLNQVYIGEQLTGFRDDDAPRMMARFAIAPIGAVRLVRSSAYNPSPAAQRYFAWKEKFAGAVYDAVTVHKLFKLSELESRVWWRFYQPMPASWSRKRRLQHAAQPCHSKPDWDNCAKAVYDAIFVEDKRVWDVRGSTLWSEIETGYITVHRMAD